MIRKSMLDSSAVKRAVTRITHEILEANKGVENLALIGIRSGGVVLAHMIKEKVHEIEGETVPVGTIDVTLYRDDLAAATHHPTIRSTEIEFSIDGKIIILVDDVLYTGRTVRAAMDAIMDFGRPKMIKLAVLIDRGHRELPIKANFIGRNIPTSKKDLIKVMFEGDIGVDLLINNDEK